MAKTNTGVSIEEEVLQRNNAIREALKEQDELNRGIDRSELIERLLHEWNEEHAHVLEEREGDDSGNRMLAATAAD